MLKPCPALRSSIAFVHRLSSRCQNDITFVAVLYGDAMPEIITAFLKVPHLAKSRALDLGLGFGGGGPVAPVRRCASGCASDPHTPGRHGRKKIIFDFIMNLGSPFSSPQQMRP